MASSSINDFKQAVRQRKASHHIPQESHKAALTTTHCRASQGHQRHLSPSIVTSVLLVPPEPTPPNRQRSTGDSVCELEWEECYDVCAHPLKDGTW